MNEKPEATHHYPPAPSAPRTVTRFEHAVRRCTSEDHAKKALDEAYANGYELKTSGCGGQDGQVIWFVFQRTRQEVAQPTVEQGPPVPQGPAGGQF
jgi:hypothetical protein